MACERSPFLPLACLFLALLCHHQVSGTSVPAIFIFGDSTADVGNNNFLPTPAKANFPHNGVDFAGARPTGRFSNGFNTADFIAKLMGFTRSPPPFLSLTEHALVKKAFVRGLNFASAASGILPTTGSRYGRVLSMGEQVRHFATVHARVTARFGSRAAALLFSESLFLVSTGSNDIFDDYAARGPLNWAQKEEFIGSVASEYRDQLRTLYRLGARKLGIVSIPPIGCCPSQRSLNASGGCLDDLNESARRFHRATKAILAELGAEFGDLSYALGNAYEMVANILENPTPSGFKELKNACCGAGRFSGQSPCLPFVPYCSRRGEYLFWDWFHPTHAGSKLAAWTLYDGPQRFVEPINLRQLAGNGTY